MADPSYIVDGVLTDGEAWVALASTTVAGSPVASVEYESPDDGSSLDWCQFMDLVVIMYIQDGVTSQATGEISLKINDNGTNANYKQQLLSGNGSSAAASNPAASRIVAEVPAVDSGGTTIFGSSVIYFFDINSGKYKSVLCQNAADRDGAGTVAIRSIAFTGDQEAISMLRFGATELNIAVGSKIDLFGVLPRMVA